MSMNVGECGRMRVRTPVQVQPALTGAAYREVVPHKRLLVLAMNA